MRLVSACIMAAGLGYTIPVSGYDPAQSTGTGTVQGEDASMSTTRGGNTGPTTGRNEHSGSGTGAVRDTSRAEPEQDRSKGSSQLGSDSSHEASQQERSGDGGRGQGGVRTNK
ncbi:MAG: hypothetical protein AB7G68_07440 [Nitrospiraceae bacterium]